MKEMYVEIEWFWGILILIFNSNKIQIFGYTVAVKNAAFVQNILRQRQNYNTAPRLKARLFIKTLKNRKRILYHIA